MSDLVRGWLLAWATAGAVFLIPATGAAQAGQAAVLTGTVTDASQAPVAGATVSAASPSLIGGLRSTVTSAGGTYRFPFLPPGLYIVTAEREGFTTTRHENIRLLLGQTARVDHTLSASDMPVTVLVAGAAPEADVRPSSAAYHLPQEVLEFIPFPSRFGPAAMLLAPGVSPTTYSAYGSSGSPANAYMLEGVDVSDPDSGTIWVFTNHNWIQDVQIIGLGADAEFGGFTGVASNTLFRSGGHVFHGLAETLYERGYVTDSTLQAGGPIARERAWFFTGVQYHRASRDARVESSPRFLFRPTMRLGQSGQLAGFLAADRYTVDPPMPARRQESPQAAWNIAYTNALTPASVFDIRYAGFRGHYDLSPSGDDDLATSLHAGRSRHQANASVTRFWSAAGEHTLKVGAEVERSRAANELDAGFGGVNTRVSVYAQDSWRLGSRLTLNPGIRVDHNRGFVERLDATVFRTTSLGPRLGFAYDLSGRAGTVLIGHWGRYVDGAKSVYYDQLTPSNAFDGRHPRVDQAILGVQHQLFGNLSASATGIYRRHDDAINDRDGNFRGIEFMAGKRLSNRWMVQASWVIGSNDTRLANGTTHLVKVLGIWRAPFGINASTAFLRASGETLLTARQRLGAESFGQPGDLERHDAASRWDLKLEREFGLGDRRRLGLTLEGFNLLNATAITRVVARPGDAPDTPAAVNQPRRFRLGAVLRF